MASKVRRHLVVGLSYYRMMRSPKERVGLLDQSKSRPDAGIRINLMKTEKEIKARLTAYKKLYITTHNDFLEYDNYEDMAKSDELQMLIAELKWILSAN